MDVVVNMLACDDWSDRVTLVGSALHALVLELVTLLLETGLDGLGITVVKLFGLYGSHVVFMTLWEYLTVLDRLNGSVEVILVYFTINGCLGLLVTVFRDGFLNDSRGNSLMNSGVMVAGLVPTEGSP